MLDVIRKKVTRFRSYCTPRIPLSSASLTFGQGSIVELDMELGALVECTVWCVITASRHLNTRVVQREEYQCFLSYTIPSFVRLSPLACAPPFKIVCIFVNRLFPCPQSERTCPSVAWFYILTLLTLPFFFSNHWEQQQADHKSTHHLCLRSPVLRRMWD